MSPQSLLPEKSRKFEISVPATSANLGPGFDSIGIAVDLRLRASVRPAEAFHVSFIPGDHAPTHDGFREEILRGFDAISRGARPPLEIRVDNPIPLGKGLGSSAAANVLGARIAVACYPDQIDRLPSVVTNLEGHPDNALPALLGGVIVAAQRGEDEPSYLRFAIPPRLRTVIAIPEIELATSEARAILPERYRKEDVVYNIQRAALLAASFASGDLSNMRIAMGDRVHQPYRSAAVPGLSEALQLEMPGLLGVALSGAGPSLLAFVDSNADDVAAALKAVFARHKIASTTLVLGLTNVGATVRDSDESLQTGNAEPEDSAIGLTDRQ
jgi:homoserine kinase